MFNKIDEKTYRLCGTNSLNPKCRYYQFDDDDEKKRTISSSLFRNESSGIGIAPLRAFEKNYVYNYISEKRYLFSANSIDLNRHFTSINRLNMDDESYLISTNIDDRGWIHSKI